LAAIFFVSGVAGLVYELLWLRILALTFGVTNYAVSTVLASFMAGLALGSIVAGRFADRLKHPLRTYAILEVLIGVTGVLTLAAFAGLQELYRAAHPHLAQSPMLLTVGRFVLSFLILMVPTSLMGATLPVFLRSSLVRDSHAGTHLSLIYAVNTFGAIVGCLAAPFLIIGTIGIRNGIFLAAALNLLAAVLAWGVSVGERGEVHPSPQPPPRNGEGEPAADRKSSPLSVSGRGVRGEGSSTTYPASVRTLAFWVIGISGLLSLAYEVVWARLLSVCFDASVYSFSIMLAVYLLGLAAGSAAVKPLMGRRLPWPAVLAGVEFLIGITALFSLYWLSQFGWEAQDEEIRRPLLVSFIALFPPTFLMGASFPIAAEIFTAGLPEVGRRVGTIYAVNVCGSILGSLIGGFLLLPQLGVEASLKLLVVASALLGGVMFAGSPGVSRAHRPWWALGAVALLALTLTRMPPLYDTLFARRFPGEKAIWRQEGIENTVTIAEAPGQRVMYLNGHHQANDSKGMIEYHAVIGHLPMLLHPNPRRALVIGLGGGATPGAVTQYPDTIVDCVELSPSVVAGARFFEHVNHAVLKQPNLRMKVDDGRNHLLLTREKYDVITADVIMPHHAGAGNLYSVDYYTMCRDALAPGGMMCQWIWQNSRFQYQLMMRSFLRAFPYVTLWKDGSLLIGSNEPIRLSRAAIAAKFAHPTSRAALDLVGLHNADEVLALYTGNRDEALAYVGDGPVVTDDRPLIEYYRSTQEMTDVPSQGRIASDVRRAFKSRPPVQ
jgi:spermidine synthase